MIFLCSSFRISFSPPFSFSRIIFSQSVSNQGAWNSLLIVFLGICLSHNFSIEEFWGGIRPQWRNVAIWCPLLIFLPPPTNFLLSPNKQKKVATFFSVFLIGFLPLLGAFCTPKYIFFASTERYVGRDMVHFAITY